MFAATGRSSCSMVHLLSQSHRILWHCESYKNLEPALDSAAGGGSDRGLARVLESPHPDRTPRAHRPSPRPCRNREGHWSNDPRRPNRRLLSDPWSSGTVDSGSGLQSFPAAQDKESTRICPVSDTILTLTAVKTWFFKPFRDEEDPATGEL